MRRRSLLRGAVLLPAAALLGVLGGRLVRGRAAPSLLSEGLAVGPDGVVWPLAPGQRPTYLPGSRVLASGPACAGPPYQGVESEGSGPEEQARLARDRRAAALLPTGRWAALCSDALDDLLALTGPVLAEQAWDCAVSTVPVSQESAAGPAATMRYPRGAVVAAPVSWWRYVWPRDAAFAALALSRCGLLDEALDVLSHLASLQDLEGGLQARYTAAGERPDARPPQSDGVGWLAWATGKVLAQVPVGARGAQVAVLETALVRSGERLLRLTAGTTSLPPASPDYWEVRERFTTLGTAAPTLLGLEAVSQRATLPAGLRAQAASRAASLREAITAAFAPGWGRYPRLAGAAVGSPGHIDAALTLVLPPFTAALPGALEVRAHAVERMARPGGGVAPGEGWRRDGVSWTPETALLAWSAAGLGRREEAERLLGWLESHRTRAGALPEKVLADGTPAGPAPLAWTCALVLLAAHELQG
ncbi:glycoside hydrolase family 15 protein [Actinomyces weissii]|uniref:Glycoside hydrolase family 15 n=1 Tax=Actinomyces weissii TaxID=675090 RepID=A0A7T7S2K6_9ACTO|nr:glycoside hydrolase family 15 [Actinomyces weissii]QQM67529.1 glycoside hydrolase family 15 [Actinomyces weissii]